MEERLVALNKRPGIRPVGIREVCLLLSANLVLRYGGSQAKEACRTVDLCAGLEAGIEGAIHALKEREGL